MKNNRIELLGLSIDNLSMQETLDRIGEIISAKKPVQHVVVNAAKIVHAQKDNHLKSVINNCGLINADGQAVVWAARILGIPLKERVAGIDLMYNILKISPEKGWRIYFLGAKEEIVKKVVEKAKVDFPGIRVAGFRNGYFKDNDEENIVQGIKESGADILFVAISSPQKEIFLNKYMKEMNVPFCMGVGGSFDVYAGHTKRAPVWLQRIGMEWFYRILQEPRRMWKRYATTNPVFIYLVMKNLIRGKK